MMFMTEPNRGRTTAKSNRTSFAPQFRRDAEDGVLNTDTAAVQWTPEMTGVVIASETNPWLQVNGEPVDLTGMMLEGNHDCDCYQFSGAQLGMDSETGIQRCDTCLRFDGDLEAAAAVAEALTEMTGKEHTVWFEPETPATDLPQFVWDGDYNNREQVRPYMEKFLAEYDRIVAAGKYPYNDSFKGLIPEIAGDREDTAIYMLQNLRDIDEDDRKLEAFLAEGAVPLDQVQVEGMKSVRGDLAAKGWYVGGTGWKVIRDVRLSKHNGRVMYTPKGRQNLWEMPAREMYFIVKAGR